MSEERRRKSHIDIDASYAALGASEADDLLKFPPQGATAFEHESLLGSGEDRFVSSTSMLMTWQAQKGAGLKVQLLSPAAPGVYSGPNVSDHGEAQIASTQTQDFAADGTPFMQAGEIVEIGYDPDVSQKMRILRIIDEKDKSGFVMGSAATALVIGEVFFRVEMREDNSVWAIARGFYQQDQASKRPIKAKKRIKLLIASAKNEIFALTPAGIAESKTLDSGSDS